jgi:predicted nuclease of predicted toxin-antitoxin system
MNLLIDENMPRSLAGELAAAGFNVQDVREIGLRGRPDEEVFQAAATADAIIITRDRGFTYEKKWPTDFTAGVVFINLPDDSPASFINSKVTALLTQRLPESLLGAITFVESQRALSQIVRRRPKSSTKAQDIPDKQGEKDETLDAQLDETRTD